MQLFEVIFQLFVGKKKKNFFWKHCSVRTEKLHRKKVKKIFLGGKNFFRVKNQFFLGLILFWNKSLIHRGPYSIVSVRVSEQQLASSRDRKCFRWVAQVVLPHVITCEWAEGKRKRSNQRALCSEYYYCTRWPLRIVKPSRNMFLELDY